MITANHIAEHTAPLRVRRKRRLPIVMLMLLGMLVSLLHCAGDSAAFAHGGGVTVSMTDTGVDSDHDNMLPAHSGHCLSHITEHTPVMMTLPADVIVCASVLARPSVPPSRAGLPLFKPPRA
jgi:hypothetical protein